MTRALATIPQCIGYHLPVGTVNLKRQRAHVTGIVATRQTIGINETVAGISRRSTPKGSGDKTHDTYT